MGSDSEGSSGRPDPTDWHPPGDRDRYTPGGGGGGGSSGGGNQGPYPSSVPGGYQGKSLRLYSEF